MFDYLITEKSDKMLGFDEPTLNLTLEVDVDKTLPEDLKFFAEEDLIDCIMAEMRIRVESFVKSLSA